MFIAELFVIAKTGKCPESPLMDEWIKKMWYIHTMDYYAALEKTILSFVTTWTGLEGQYVK